MSQLLENEAATFIDIPGESEDISDIQKTVDDELNDIFMEIGGDDRDTVFRLKVARVMEGKGKTAHCFYCLPSELPIIDKIKNEYGAGEYQIIVYKNSVIFRRRTLNIAKTLPKPIAPAALGGSTDIQAIMTAMAEQNRVQMENFQKIIMMQQTAVVPVAAPTVDPMQMMTSMVTAMAQLNGLMPKGGGGEAGMDNFIKGVELAKQFAGENNGTEKGLADVLITAAREFGPPLLDMASKVAPQPRPGTPLQPQPGNAPQPGAVPDHPGQPLPRQPVQEADPMYMLKMQLKMLVSKALSGADPALYADLMLDSMDENQIREFLGRPDLYEFLTGLNSGVARVWPWFERLQREVMEALDGDAPNMDNEGFSDTVENLTIDEKTGHTPPIEPQTEEPSHDAPEFSDSPTRTGENNAPIDT